MARRRKPCSDGDVDLILEAAERLFAAGHTAPAVGLLSYLRRVDAVLSPEQGRRAEAVAWGTLAAVGACPGADPGDDLLPVN